MINNNIMKFVKITIQTDNLYEIYYTDVYFIENIINRCNDVTTEFKDIIKGKFTFEIYDGKTYEIMYMFENDLNMLLNINKKEAYAICGFCNSGIIRNDDDIIIFKNDMLYHSICYGCISDMEPSQEQTDISILIGMGFSFEDSISALHKNNNDLEKTVLFLTDSEENYGVQESKEEENNNIQQQENDLLFGTNTKDDIINNLRVENNTLQEEIERLENILKKYSIDF